MDAQSQQCEFFTYVDLMNILGIGKTKVYEYLNELEAQGKVVRVGKKKLVRKVVLYQLLASQDGYMPHEYRTAEKANNRNGLMVLNGGKGGEK